MRPQGRFGDAGGCTQLVSHVLYSEFTVSPARRYVTVMATCCILSSAAAGLREDSTRISHLIILTD
jgi:hypothetical protein